MTAWRLASDVNNLWSPDEFLERLKAIGAAHYHDKHPFHVRMQQGKLEAYEIRLWIANRFYYQQNLPVKDALIISKLPTREDRREWLQRVIDHDGRLGQEGGIEAWLNLGEAAQLNREDMLAGKQIVPGVRFAVDGYVNYCRLRSWYEAVASSLTELFAPDLVAQRIDAFDRYYSWIKPEGLNYFRRRLSEAPRDADHALTLVLSHARTRQAQEAAAAALKFKCDVLWSMLDAIERQCSPGTDESRHNPYAVVS